MYTLACLRSPFKQSVPDFLLLVREHQVRVHPGRDAFLVAAFLAPLPVLVGHVAPAELLADVALSGDGLVPGPSKKDTSQVVQAM